MTEKCLIPNCDRTLFTRGLCKSCYLNARLYIKNQETTWKELIKRNLAKEKVSSFDMAIEQVRIPYVDYKRRVFIEALKQSRLETS